MAGGLGEQPVPLTLPANHMQSREPPPRPGDDGPCKRRFGLAGPQVIDGIGNGLREPDRAFAVLRLAAVEAHAPCKFNHGRYLKKRGRSPAVQCRWVRIADQSLMKIQAGCQFIAMPFKVDVQKNGRTESGWPANSANCPSKRLGRIPSSAPSGSSHRKGAVCSSHR